MDFHKKANREFFNNQLLFKTVGIILIVIFFILVVADIRIYIKKRDLDIQISNYKKQIEDLKKSSQTLNAEIANSDSVDYLEKLAYEQLGQQKPGEKEVIFIAPQEKEKPSGKSQTFWNTLTGWFSGVGGWITDRF